jgi:cell division transport system ATP-binding protein
VIHIKHVSKIYYPRRVVALQDINVRIRPGEFVFLVGASGAGKSTFLKLLYREELPSEGQLLIGGKDVARLRQRDVPYLRRRIGIIFQDFKLLPDRTVFENVAFALRVTEASPKEIRRRVPTVLEMVGLAEKERHYPSQLSGGEQQRVGLARALVNRPPLILADEPTGNLDPQTSLEIMALLEQINRMGATVVMATHASNIVDMFRKRVIALDRGRIVRDQERGVYSNEAKHLEVHPG